MDYTSTFPLNPVNDTTEDMIRQIVQHLPVVGSAFRTVEQ